ncbi:imidazole glycerol phosphate synthase subunit HisH [Patescibacteria group bacterium AH-259-L07]|nr:imidazole glycerol phosphate synthase subunit HisH [Patescibacteria group bacterium AH-259-L07]
MIAIIDYKAGNIASVKNALERLGRACVVTSDLKKILSADGVIFPGQGRAGAAMPNLRKTGIDKVIPKITKPFLGICLGMQLLGSYSEEDQTKCLGIFQGACRKFPPTLKTPHLGWNKVELTQESPLIAGIPDGSYFYFVHSYYVDPVRSKKPLVSAALNKERTSNGVDALEAHIVGKTSYGFDFPSIMQKDNFFAVQFHPEKSGAQGLRLLNNFCELCL